MSSSLACHIPLDMISVDWWSTESSHKYNEFRKHESTNQWLANWLIRLLSLSSKAIQHWRPKVKGNNRVESSAPMWARNNMLARPCQFFQTPQAICQIQGSSPNSNIKQANLKQKWEGKEQKGVVTVPCDLAEAPVVAALRRGVRIQRHGARRSHRLPPLTPPQLVIVEKRQPST